MCRCDQIKKRCEKTALCFAKIEILSED